MRYFLCLLALPMVFADCRRPASIDYSGLEYGKDQSYSYRIEKTLLRRQPRRLEKLKEDLLNYRVLFVPGFLSDAVINFGRKRDKIKNALEDVFNELGLDTDKLQDVAIGDYFSDQLEWFEKQGLSVERVELADSEASIDANAELIRDRIDYSVIDHKKDVILFTHSKGGLDTLEALLRFPRLRRHVAGWVAVQSPFFGTPAVEIAESSAEIDKFLKRYLKLVHGGDEKSLDHLKPSVRQAYMRKNLAEIKELVNEVPILSYTSTKFRGDGPFWDTDLWPVRDQLLKKDARGNDGAVPLESAKLPYAPWVYEEEVDHVAVFSRSRALPFERVFFTLALIKKALE